MDIRSQLQELFHEEGLELLGLSRPEYPRDFARFENWIAGGKQAGMHYMEAHRECRKSPSQLLPGAKTIISFALPYAQGDRLAKQWKQGRPVPRVAQYARFTDYHKLFKQKGQRVVASLEKRFAGDYRVVVDSAPVLERALAAKTRLGFIGKNTCYIHPTLGSFLLLGEIVTTLEVTPDEKDVHEDCGDCVRCQRYCPTGALNEAYQLDANRCLAYWTIEHRGPIPMEFWPHLGTYLFGCDICQLVCPFNEGVPKNTTLKTKDIPSLFEMATMDQKNYEAWFGGTPMTRAKREGLQRNALIAMVVTADPKVSEATAILSSDPAPAIAETLAQVKEYQRSLKQTALPQKNH